MHNQTSSFYEPTENEEWNYSTDDNCISLENKHLWHYQESTIPNDEVLLPDQYLLSEGASFAFGEEYVLFEEGCSGLWEEHAPRRNVKQGKRIRDLRDNDVLSFPCEENNEVIG